MNKPQIGFVGGVSVGVKTFIQSLWPSFSDEQNFEINNTISVEESVPGRGLMRFNVKKLHHVIYSQSNNWIADENNRKDINDCSTIAFVLPASSLGYSEEISFIKKLYNECLLKGKHIVVLLSKADYLYEENCQQMQLTQIAELWENIKNIYISLQDVLDASSFSINSIVPVSAENDWNYDSVRELLWESVIENYNDTQYNASIPTIVIVGKRGSGKSSTLNELFGLNLPTNKSVACTKYPMVIKVTYNLNDIKYEWNLVDLPGIAESIDADMRYNAFYQKYIDNASLLLCLSQADTRAYLRDEEFYAQLIGSNVIKEDTKILIGINQIDLLFKSKEYLNGIDLHSISPQHELIQAKIDDCFENIYKKIFINHNLTREDVCVFSALQKWNFESLLKQIIIKTYN